MKSVWGEGGWVGLRVMGMGDDAVWVTRWFAGDGVRVSWGIEVTPHRKGYKYHVFFVTSFT
jgi:hypothetical protein